MRAMFAWHAIEEMEHKSVAYDVMQKVAKVGYGLRSWTMLNAILAFNFHSLMITWYMLKHDGFSTRERLQMFQDNLPWLYGREGLYRRLMPGLLAYFNPGFHPWQTKTIHSYKTWLDTLEQTGSAMQAGQALYEAAY